MPEPEKPGRAPEPEDDFARQIKTKEARKLKAQASAKENVWFGLGMFGLIGWSVAIPTLLGVALGIWIDHTWPSRYSWTLMLLLLGIILGCLNAWRWISQERQKIDKGQ
jgi:ATP synthase protein I